MKKQQEKQEKHGLDEFEDYSNLWTITQNGTGRAIELLRKIVDSIQAENYSNPGNRLPTVLITGPAKELTAKAFINSLKIDDIRECPGRYLDNGMNSSQLFEDSLFGTAHLITDIEHLTTMGQSVVWRYLKEGQCTYYNFFSKDYSKIIHCNGLIVLTARKPNDVAQSILQKVTHSVNTESYSADQLKQFACQQLQFCGITYKGQAVLDEIVRTYPIEIDSVIQLIKTCVVLLEADLSNSLTVKIVKEAKKLCSLSVPPDHRDDDDIPF